MTFLVFLFSFYLLAKEDFVFVRKNITLEQLFDTIFLGLPIVLLFARIFYIALHPKWIYLNPLVFLALPYFPGLFLGGAVIGAVIFLYFFTRKKKIPLLRFTDEIALAFLAGASFYFLWIGIQEVVQRQVVGIVSGVMVILYFVSYLLTKRVFASEKWKDGVVAAFVMLLYSLFSVLYVTILVILRHKFVVTPEEIFYVGLLLISFVLFFMRRISPQRSI